MLLAFDRFCARQSVCNREQSRAWQLGQRSFIVSRVSMRPGRLRQTIRSPRRGSSKRRNTGWRSRKKRMPSASAIRRGLEHPELLDPHRILDEIVLGAEAAE
jgi:hypothetical protein